MGGCSARRKKNTHRKESVPITKIGQLTRCKEVTDAHDEGHKQYVYRVWKKFRLLNATTTA